MQEQKIFVLKVNYAWRNQRKKDGKTRNWLIREKAKSVID